MIRVYLKNINFLRRASIVRVLAVLIVFLFSFEIVDRSSHLLKDNYELANFEKDFEKDNEEIDDEIDDDELLLFSTNSYIANCKNKSNKVEIIISLPNLSFDIEIPPPEKRIAKS